MSLNQSPNHSTTQKHNHSTNHLTTVKSHPELQAMVGFVFDLEGRHLGQQVHLPLFLVNATHLHEQLYQHTWIATRKLSGSSLLHVVHVKSEILIYSYLKNVKICDDIQGTGRCSFNAFARTV